MITLLVAAWVLSPPTPDPGLPTPPPPLPTSVVLDDGTRLQCTLGYTVCWGPTQ